ncbi:MAG: hypothetical protein F6K65_18145 [Moorea sp. SIO3C2]|nr:hypothetical protein [Moorena sp. SIO3C2]
MPIPHPDAHSTGATQGRFTRPRRRAPTLKIIPLLSNPKNPDLPISPSSRFPTPDSRLPTPDSRLPTPDSRLPNIQSLFP